MQGILRSNRGAHLQDGDAKLERFDPDPNKKPAVYDTLQQAEGRDQPSGQARSVCCAAASAKGLLASTDSTSGPFSAVGAFVAIKPCRIAEDKS